MNTSSTFLFQSSVSYQNQNSFHASSSSMSSNSSISSSNASSHHLYQSASTSTSTHRSDSSNNSGSDYYRRPFSINNSNHPIIPQASSNDSHNGTVNSNSSSAFFERYTVPHPSNNSIVPRAPSSNGSLEDSMVSDALTDSSFSNLVLNYPDDVNSSSGDSSLPREARLNWNGSPSRSGSLSSSSSLRNEISYPPQPSTFVHPTDIFRPMTHQRSSPESSIYSPDDTDFRTDQEFSSESSAYSPDTDSHSSHQSASQSSYANAYAETLMNMRHSQDTFRHYQRRLPSFDSHSSEDSDNVSLPSLSNSPPQSTSYSNANQSNLVRINSQTSETSMFLLRSTSQSRILQALQTHFHWLPSHYTHALLYGNRIDPQVDPSTLERLEMELLNILFFNHNNIESNPINHETSNVFSRQFRRSRYTHRNDNRPRPHSMIPREIQGAHDDSISSLKTLILQNVQFELKENQKDCCICLEEFKKGQRIKYLPCDHVFHDHCVDRWLRVNGVCPYCKLEIK